MVGERGRRRCVSEVGKLGILAIEDVDRGCSRILFDSVGLRLRLRLRLRCGGSSDAGYWLNGSITETR